ncbi:hypothetical protein [Streptomyces sp. NPDC005262]|uniref:hypothetical protein n=1 Tax=Streptomyces sp. NPDC005262 TaxID=3364710 RepID=UPI003693BD08
MTAIDSPAQSADPASKLTCVFASWRCSPRFRMRLPHQTYTKAMSPADYHDPRAPQLLDRPAWVRVTDCMVWPHSVYTATSNPMT